MIRHLAVFILTAAGIHAATVWYLPLLAMNTAMGRFEESGIAANTIAHVPPTDATSRRVVRPSPDLLYSVCLLDLSEGPVHVRAAEWGGYVSLSLFAANTDNVAAINDSRVEGDVGLTVANGGGADIDLGSARGIALIRRLVTDSDTLSRADTARLQGDSCERIDPS